MEDIMRSMGVKVMRPVDTKYIDKVLFDEEGLIKIVPACRLENIPQDHLMQWCVKNAIYQIPTEELIEWLSARISGRKAIEIGSGNGGVGCALGIPSTDSYLQTIPAIQTYYRMLQQEPVVPPAYVEKLEALEAIEKYQPEVVVGCYITQRHKEGELQGNAFGPEEELIIAKVGTYIHVGNLGPHGSKRILAAEHEEFKFSWLYSRSLDQSKNFISVWDLQLV